MTLAFIICLSHRIPGLSSACPPCRQLSVGTFLYVVVPRLRDRRASHTWWEPAASRAPGASSVSWSTQCRRSRRCPPLPTARFTVCFPVAWGETPGHILSSPRLQTLRFCFSSLCDVQTLPPLQPADDWLLGSWVLIGSLCSPLGGSLALPTCSPPSRHQTTAATATASYPFGAKRQNFTEPVT